MQTRQLGGSGMKVGAIGLGCMGMSWAYGQSNDAESTKVIQRALDLGVTLIDTADVYGPFSNEELVGRALVGRRDDVVLATKCGLVAGDGEIRRRATPDHIAAACDASLRRLQTDHIDLYQLHRVDPTVPIEESVAAMARLVDAGKVRAIGLSEVTTDEAHRARRIAPVASIQSELSLWTRDPLDGVLPWCLANGVAFIPFSPLGRGFLTGKVRSTDAFGEADFRARNPRFQAQALESNLAIVDAVQAVADRLGATAGQVAIAWVLAQGDQVVPIPGTKRLAWLEENVAAAGLALSPEDLAELDALPAPAGARY